MKDYALLLLLTTLIEGLVVIVALRFVGLRNAVAPLLFVVAVNLLTHPLATLAVFSGGDWWSVEIAVLALESVALSKVAGWGNAHGLSMAVLMNVASASVGWAIGGYGSVPAG